MTRGRMRWRVPRSAGVVALVGAALVLALGEARSDPPVADAVVVAADGDLDLQNSREGLPILSAAGLGPGDTASGQVTVTNAGTGSGQFSLKRHILTDTPGAGGGALSERLQLVVRDVTSPASPTTVYSGALGAMPEKPLGTLGPGQVRTYRFDASFPEGGTTDNAYAGAAASVGYRWTVSNLGEPPVEPPVDPPPDPVTPPVSGGEPPGTEDPPASTSPLQVAVKLAKQQRVKRKTLLVKVRCTEACRISAAGRIAAKGIRKPLAKTKRALKPGAAGQWVKIKLKLSKPTLAKIALAKAQRRKVSVKVKVNARTAAGSTAKAAKSGRIR